MTNVSTYVRNLQTCAAFLIYFLIHITTLSYWFKETYFCLDNNLVYNIRCDFLSTGKRLGYDVYGPRLHLYFPDECKKKYDVIYKHFGINIIVVCTQSPFILCLFSKYHQAHKFDCFE
jgi:hypothetical protein